MAAHFALRNTKNCGGEKRSGKSEGGQKFLLPNPSFLPARAFSFGSAVPPKRGAKPRARSILMQINFGGVCLKKLELILRKIPTNETETMRTRFCENYFLGKGFAKTSAHLFLNSDVANGKGGVWGGMRADLGLGVFGNSAAKLNS